MVEPTSKKRRALRAVLVLAALVGGSCPVAHGLASRRLAAFHERWIVEVADARGRAAKVRVPVLRGTALDEDAVPRYRAISASISSAQGGLFEHVSGDPAAPVSSNAAALARSCAPQLAAVREAIRCARCDWDVPYEQPWSARAHSFNLGELARLLVVEGHLRAQAGDPRGAAVAYLDAVRFSADLERGDGGPSALALALESLAHLVASDWSALLPLDELEAELDRAASTLPPLVDSFREVRLDVLGRLALAAERGSVDEEFSFDLGRVPRLLPRRLVAVHALSVLDVATRDAERALDGGDLEPWARTQEAIHAWGWGERTTIGMPSWNALALDLYPSPASWADGRNVALSWIAFCRVAIALEGRASPRDVSGIALPADPFNPSLSIRLRLADDGVGYTLSTPGPVRFHDGMLDPHPITLVRAR